MLASKGRPPRLYPTLTKRWFPVSTTPHSSPLAIFLSSPVGDRWSTGKSPVQGRHPPPRQRYSLCLHGGASVFFSYAVSVQQTVFSKAKNPPGYCQVLPKQAAESRFPNFCFWQLRWWLIADCGLLTFFFPSFAGVVIITLFSPVDRFSTTAYIGVATGTVIFWPQGGALSADEMDRC